MKSFGDFQEAAITGKGRIGLRFQELGVRSLRDACRWVQELPYGYNSNPDDAFSLFADGMGTCSSKHGVIAELAEELGVPIFKYIGFYRLDESIVEGVERILAPHGLSFIPQTHCVLGFHATFVDLTAGNCHGKKKDVVDMDLLVRVPPSPNRKLKEEIYLFGLAFYKRNDPALARLSDCECLEILRQCDEAHRFMCALLPRSESVIL